MARVEDRYDVAIFGAGPGGIDAALRAKELGLTTVLIGEQLGGVCLNIGCIPTEAMLVSAGRITSAAESGEFGVTTQVHNPDYAKAVQRRDKVVAKLGGYIEQSLRVNRIPFIKGRARFANPFAADITAEDGSQQEILFNYAIVATGSKPKRLQIPGVELQGVIDSDRLLNFTSAPERAVFVGAGKLGVEDGEMWTAFGTKAVVLEKQAQILPSQDGEVAKEFQRLSERRGIKYLTEATILEIQRVQNGLVVVADVRGIKQEFPTDVVVMCIGRDANVEGLGLENAGLTPDEEGIYTSSDMRTRVPHIFAVGDVTGRFQLAQIASTQGVIAAEVIAGLDSRFDDSVIESAVFTDPEIASVGLTEKAALDQNMKIIASKARFLASGRGVASGEDKGFAKVIVDEDSGEVVGVHIIGSRAGDLIAAPSQAVALRLRITELIKRRPPHPSHYETVYQAYSVAAKEFLGRKRSTQ